VSEESTVPLSALRAPIAALQPVSKRISFVYVERSVVHRDANAIVAMNDEGVTHIPGASITALLLGPGTRITHQAMNLLGESGVTTCWVGEGGARLYASAPSLSRTTRLLERQARLVSNRSSRLAVARHMYQLRFPDDVSRATMQRLRGMEGARVRQAYRHEAERVGIEWKGRRYDPKEWSAGDVVNRALSVANSCLYGVVHSVIVAIGCSPGLGFVHSGHSLAFVYDVADLYKAEVTIPAAFSAAAEGETNLAGRVRRLVRERIYDHHVLDRAVDDIAQLLGTTDTAPDEAGLEALVLWDDNEGSVPAGTAYGDDP